MRATNYKHLQQPIEKKPIVKHSAMHSDTTAGYEKRHAAARKSRVAFKVVSGACALALAAAIFIIPTTTLAPGVEAYSDNSLAVAEAEQTKAVNELAPIAAETTVGKSEGTATAKTAAAAQPTTAAAKKSTAKAAAAQSSASAKTTTTAPAAAKTTSKVSATSKATVQPTTQAVTKAQQSAASTKTASTAKSAASTASTASKSTTSVSASTKNAAPKATESVSYSNSYVYDEDDYSSFSNSTGSSSSQSGALLSIANPDYSYSPKHINLSAYDRDIIERLVYGEVGETGYLNCCIVAQAIRDAMNIENTSSVDDIIYSYGYYGSLNFTPNSDVKNAVSFIFDQDGMAMQHRVICFYIGTSDWHETQEFLYQSPEGIRFFDLVY